VNSGIHSQPCFSSKLPRDLDPPPAVVRRCPSAPIIVTCLIEIVVLSVTGVAAFMGFVRHWHRVLEPDYRNGVVTLRSDGEDFDISRGRRVFQLGVEKAELEKVPANP
jgi:hypothetical protein